MNIITTCGVVYRRNFGGGLQQGLSCTYMKSHPGEHSWQEIHVADHRAGIVGWADDPAAPTPDPAPHMPAPPPATESPRLLPSEVADVIEGIDAGEYDPYLEILLAVAHDRKRVLRSVPGFPRLWRGEH